jgi:hypothetical protein
MIRLLAIVGLLFSYSVDAQYFFNDLVANKQTHTQYQLLRKWRVRSFTVVAAPDQPMAKEEVLINQEISMDGKKIVTYSNENSGKTYRTITQYEGGKLIRSVAGTRTGDITTQFIYTSFGLPQKIQSTTRDTALGINQLEVHTYFYIKDTLPDYAYVIRDNSDTLKVFFVLDSLQLVAEEKWMRGNKQVERYYYYYDNNRRLTDIVRFNNKAGRLLPDFIFSHDDNSRISKMIQVPRYGNNYLSWEYSYDEKGLKTAEKMTSKDKQQSATLYYRYNY